MIEPNIIYCESWMRTLERMEDESIDNCITSPPYWGLRDYGTATWEGGDDPQCNHKGRPHRTRHSINFNTSALFHDKKNLEYFEPFRDICGKCGAVRIDEQIGVERTPEEYVAKLVAGFHQVKRAMKKDGTCWINLGDTYWGGKGQSNQAWSTEHQDRQTLEKNQHQIASYGETRPQDGKHPIIKPKDLVGIPWMVAFALRADGWYLRSDIIWNKENPMPESVKDRPTKAHEYLFLLTKSQSYYYDGEAIKVDMVKYEVERRLREKEKGLKSVYALNRDGKTGQADQSQTGAVRNMLKRQELAELGKANKRTVWTVASTPFPDAHFAVMPEELIEPCVLTTRPDAIIYDPFSGSGTTAVVTLRAGRRFVGSELNPEYIKIQQKRIAPYLNQIEF